MSVSKYSDSVLTTLREDEHLSRTERFYQKIRQMILSGAIQAGYTFPNENLMCQELNIGRGTLREVYQALLADGLISRSKTGTTVNSRETIIRTCPFSVVTNFASAHEIFAFRRMLEAEIVCTVAARATDEDLRACQAILDKCSSAEQTFQQYRDTDLQFHRTLVEYSHNPLLLNIFSHVWEAFETILIQNYEFLNSFSPQTIRDAQQQHQAVCDALLRRDSEGAQRAMRLHLDHVSKPMLEHSRHTYL